MANKKEKPKKQRAEKYEKPLKLKGTFLEVINELVNKPKEDKKGKK